MADRRVTIWTLNRAFNLLQHKELNIENIFLNRGISCDFGDREDHNVDDLAEDENKLMNETKCYDEYFVPIPLKCIGKLRTVKPGGDQAKLDQALDAYPWMKDQAEFESFWTKTHGTRGHVRMRTKDHKGYYEILRETPNNILIGYSQGGLVARYLAYLDEFVFKEGLITGVITLAAPNYGSPFANPTNEDEIIKAIVEMLLTIFTITGAEFDHFVKLVTDAADFGDVMAILDALGEDLRGNANKQDLDALVATATKWLGGLRGDRDNAFHELNILEHGVDGSVLQSVNRNPLKRIAQGTVITTDNDLGAVIKSMIGWKSWFLPGWIKEQFDDGGKLYRKKVMKEYLSAVPQIPQEATTKINEYKQRMGDIPQRAHDFVVPSVYQLLPDEGWKNHLKPKINRWASHNSGKCQNYKGGRKNFQMIRELLKEMREFVP